MKTEIKCPHCNTPILVRIYAPREINPGKKEIKIAKLEAELARLKEGK